MKDFGDDLFSGGFEKDDYKKGNTALSVASGYTGTIAPRCFESHKPIKLGAGTFYGGSCSAPVIDTADVYVGLDYSMRHHKSWPWLPQPKNPIIDVDYQITDYQAPSNSTTFGQMINWLCNQLHDGKTVHVGCIGGHGRTGTVFAAIMAELWYRAVDEGKIGSGTKAKTEYSFMFDLPDQKMLGEKNFIGWVRKHYCKKAVESSAQVDFLHKHFGCKKIAGAKNLVTYAGSGGSYTGGYGGYKGTAAASSIKSGTMGSVSSVPGNRLIWEKITK